MTLRSWFAALLTAALWTTCAAADIIVDDDVSHAGYDQNCSFNGVAADFDFANTDPVHSGNLSIRFTPESFNAVSGCTPLTSTVDVGGMAFWVNGGAAGCLRRRCRAARSRCPRSRRPTLIRSAATRSTC